MMDILKTVGMHLCERFPLANSKTISKYFMTITVMLYKLKFIACNISVTMYTSHSVLYDRGKNLFLHIKINTSNIIY